jgi:carbon-monoxide dehydrogenase medium subunit
VIPAAFELRRPRSLDDAVAMLAEAGEEAKLLAGGQSLIPMMKVRLVQPPLLIDIGRLADLSYIRDDGGVLAIGALTRHADVERSETVAQECRLLAQAVAEIGDFQVRNRGTIGGSLVHADPNADMAAAAVALAAELVAQGPGGRRTIPAREFFRGPLETSLAPDEVLVEVRVPKLDGAGSAYVRFSRRAQDWAIVGCAAIVRADGETVAWTGVGRTPVVADGDWREAAAALEPFSDLSGSTEYKRELAATLAERALAAARG